MPREAGPTFRELVGFETFMAVEAALFNSEYVTTVATVEPAAPPEAVAAAAAALQSRHAMLRAALRLSCSGKMFFDCKAGQNVEVRRYDGMGAQEAADAELHDGPDPGRCGWRLAVCGPHLLHTYHHSFMDGISAMMIFEELLALLSGQDLEELPPLDKWGEVPPACRDLLPGAEGVPPPLLDGPVGGWSAEAVAPTHGADGKLAGGHRTGQFWAKLSADETAKLRSLCRTEGTTVLGAIAAALPCALADVVPEPPEVIWAQAAVNLRPSLDIAARRIGTYVGIAGPGPSLVTSMPFWKRARCFKYCLDTAIGTEQHLSFPKKSFPPYKEYMANTRSRVGAPANDYGSAFFSNRGVWRLATDSYRITAMHFARAMQPGPFATVHSCTVNDELCLTLCYPEEAGGRSSETGPAVGERLLTELRRRAAEDVRRPDPEQLLFDTLLEAVAAGDGEAVERFRGDVNALGSWSRDFTLQPLPPAAYTALNAAVASSKGCIGSLLRAKADPLVKDALGTDAATLADFLKHGELAEILRSCARAGVLRPGAGPALRGTWVPTRVREWDVPDHGTDPRTVHVWDGSNTCRWQTGEYQGVAEVISTGEEDGVYGVHYRAPGLGPAGIWYGTLAMLPDGDYCLRLDVRQGHCEYMRCLAEGVA